MAETLMYGDSPLGIVGGSADNISFDDTHTSFEADTVQEAIESLNDADNIEYENGVSVKDSLDDLRFKTLETLTPLENETWQEFLIRNFDALTSQYSVFRTLQTTVQRTTSSNISNIYFRCMRRVSSATARTVIWEATYYTVASDVPSSVVYFFISLSLSGEGVKNGSIRRCYIGSDGLDGGTNFSDQSAMEIKILGPSNGEY